MLLLTRKNGERVVIGGDIRIEVVEVKGNRVRLGITAPAGVTVNREEVELRSRPVAVPGRSDG